VTLKAKRLAHSFKLCHFTAPSDDPDPSAFSVSSYCRLGLCHLYVAFSDVAPIFRVPVRQREFLQIAGTANVLHQRGDRHLNQYPRKEYLKRKAVSEASQVEKDSDSAVIF